MNGLKANQAFYKILTDHFQIYNLFLSAGAAKLGDPSQPLSWAKALQDGMLAIMKYVYMCH